MNLGPTDVFAPVSQPPIVFGTKTSGPSPVSAVYSYQSTWLSHFPKLDFAALYSDILGYTSGYQSSGLSAGLGVNPGLVINGVSRHPFTGAGY